MHDSLRRLFDHLVWADRQMFDSLATVQPERCLRLVAHIMGAGHTWLSRIHGTTPTVAIWPDLTLEESLRVAADNHRGFDELLNSAANTDNLTRTIHYTNSAGTAFTSTVSDILLHVMLHGSYHRGQVATALREAGGVPASTDFIAFARGAPAATRL